MDSFSFFDVDFKRGDVYGIFDCINDDTRNTRARDRMFTIKISHSYKSFF